MRAVIQRVKSAKLTINEDTYASINTGFLILVCVVDGDTQKEVKSLAKKIANLRIFADENGKMNKNLTDIHGACLIVSQFTLAADCKKGNRPSFVNAAKPEVAKDLYNQFINEFEQLGIETRTGQFGADMQINLINDGPVTIWLDTNDL